MYLDYRRVNLCADSQVPESAWTFCDQSVSRIPAGANPSSAVATRLVESARRSSARLFSTHAGTSTWSFSPRTHTGALKLVGESLWGAEGRYLLTFDNHNSVNGIREFTRFPGRPRDVLARRASRPARSREAAHRRLEGGKDGGGTGRSSSPIPAQVQKSSVQQSLSSIKTAAAQWTAPRHGGLRPTTNHLDLGVCKPDFMPLSFSKMFGYPRTASGAPRAQERSVLLRRPWFGGGHRRRCLGPQGTGGLVPEAVPRAPFEDEHGGATWASPGGDRSPPEEPMAATSSTDTSSPAGSWKTCAG